MLGWYGMVLGWCLLLALGFMEGVGDGGCAGLECNYLGARCGLVCRLCIYNTLYALSSRGYRPKRKGISAICFALLVI